jgi:hypothetical protein
MSAPGVADIAKAFLQEHGQLTLDSHSYNDILQCIAGFLPNYDLAEDDHKAVIKEILKTMIQKDNLLSPEGIDAAASIVACMFHTGLKAAGLLTQECQKCCLNLRNKNKRKRTTK